MRTAICLLVFFCFFTSCRQQNIFSDDTSSIRGFGSEVLLEGIPFTDQAYGILDIIAVDDKIVLTSTRRDHLFYVYDEKGVLLGEFGTIGRAGNELINCRYLGQYCTKEGKTHLLINDVSNARLVSVDLESSLSGQSLKISDIYKTLTPAPNSFLGKDSIMYIERMTDTNYEMIRYDMKNREQKTEELYSTPVDRPFSFYKSVWRKHPEKEILVAAMHSINQMNMIFPEDHGRKALVIGERTVEYYDAIDRDTGLENRTYYCDMAVSNDRIYGLWMDQPYDDAYEKPQQQEIHVFDWHGNPIQKFIVNEYITKFTVDNREKYLYGIDPNEAIYRYDIPF